MMFAKFVTNAKSHLNSCKKIWFILGNESSDLDSVVSSLVYAYFKQAKCINEFNVIPICCIPKVNMKLKKDVNTWLASFGVDSSNELVFLEDIKDMLSNGKEENIRISLVDHHKPQLPIMTSYIREVIDHRQIVYHYPAEQLEVYNVKLVGSCCTLVANYIFESESLEDFNTLLKMLHGVILVDTECLAKNNGKTTEDDIHAVEMIESFLNLRCENRSDVYDHLSRAKSDVSGFGIDMMVHRDLKILDFVWRHSDLKVAMPTLISIDVEDILAMDNLEIQFTEILKELKSNVLICLTCGTPSRLRRGYLIFSNNDELNTRICEYLFLPEHNLNLQPISVDTKMKSFYQNHLLTSRKIFIPFVDKFFSHESEMEVNTQLNNCNIDINQHSDVTIKTEDFEMDEIVEHEVTEGAPYSLNTPLRSYSSSPDNRDSDRTLPSLNNRHTLQLVDKKRQKHHAEMDVESNIYEEVQENDQVNNDDNSPPAFTPDNSDDESVSDHISDSNNDKFPSDCDNYLVTIDMKNRKKDQHEFVPEFPLLSESSLTDINHVEIQPKKHHFSKENLNDTEFISLEQKVDKKRQELHSRHIESIASALVKDIMTESEHILTEEINIESILSEWSESYAEEEKKQIIKCLNSEDLSKLADLLTSSLIKDCLHSQELVVPVGANNNASENETVHSPQKESYESDDCDSVNSLENEFSEMDIGFDDCHLGNIIKEESQKVLSTYVNSSSADVVENSSFNLYRRISSNQLDFSNDEKELLTTAGDWLPKEEIIYSDSDHEERNDNHYSSPSGVTQNEVPKKIIFPEKDINTDISNLDINTSTELSLNDIDNLPTPDLKILEELEITENVDSLSQTSSNKKSIDVSGDLENENCNFFDDNLDSCNKYLEKYKITINNAGYYFDETNNNARTQLISLSSCDLPDKSDQNYHLIMDYIFDCTISHLESIDTDFYTIVYFHCFGNQSKAPSIFWLHQSYKKITYRLKKNLKHLYIVYPTIWVRAVLFLTRFFISAKFYSKIEYVSELGSLQKYIPTSKIRFPPDVLKESI